MDKLNNCFEGTGTVCNHYVPGCCMGAPQCSKDREGKENFDHGCCKWELIAERRKEKKKKYGKQTIKR